MISYVNTNHTTVARIASGLINDGVDPFSDDYEFAVKGESYSVEHKKDGIHLTHPEDNSQENTEAAIVAIMMISAVSCITVNGVDVIYGIHINQGKSRKRLYLSLLAIGCLGLTAAFLYNKVKGTQA